MLKGIGVSPGIAVGRAFLMDREEPIIPARPVRKADIPLEIARLEDALTRTREEILAIQDKIARELGEQHAAIFTAHRMVLEDRAFIEEVIARLKKEQLCLEHIFQKVLRKYTRVFSKIEDQYLKERVSDIEDVGRRVIRILLGKKRKTLQELEEKVIVVAYDLSPSDTALMDKTKVVAFATDIGGRTSHTAIMARALEIPAVVGLEKVTQLVRPGDRLIVDGSEGRVIINPDAATLKRLKGERRKFDRFERELFKLKNLPAQTLDGHRVQLGANIELPGEVPSVIAHGAEGIGLYRTEYLYMNRTDLPDEEEQYQAYRKVASQIKPHSVIIRTMDLGGDKFLSQLDVPAEMNPFMGWRAIRFSLAQPEIFKVQLRAILRASIHGKLKILYPMISGVDELRKANEILEEVKEEFRSKKIPFDKEIESGIMIEVPSAALICDVLAKETDFFSIGTNDLIQYALAVDRVNEKIAYLYEPAHPAIVRLLKNIIDVGHQHGLWVGSCGEMSGEPHFVLLLLGLGLDELSASAVAVPEVKRIIRSVTLAFTREIARHALGLSTGKEIEDYLRSEVKKIITRSKTI